MWLGGVRADRNAGSVRAPGTTACRMGNRGSGGRDRRAHWPDDGETRAHAREGPLGDGRIRGSGSGPGQRLCAGEHTSGRRRRRSDQCVSFCAEGQTLRDDEAETVSSGVRDGLPLALVISKLVSKLS